MKDKYAIGIDYGTESGRAVVVSLDNGEEIAEHVTPYKHGVIEDKLPDSSIELESQWALQHPKDYIDVIDCSIPAVIEKAKVNQGDIVGIGIDFTSCTMLPVDSDGIPLCYDAELKNNPHSWVKLWKHHAAQNKATELNEKAAQMKEPFLARYGGKISSEWMVPKIWQVHEEAFSIYEQADRFVEAADWVVSQLTNQLAKNSCSAGYKSIWHKRDGFPKKEFFKALHPELEHLTESKLRGPVYPLGTKAGGLTQDMATRTGLKQGTAVAVGVIDAHASVPAMGVVTPGKMVMAMGTSICHMVLADEEKHIEGISGVVEDGIIPGFYGYEAGQPAGGDILGWYVDQGVPGYVTDAAKKADVSVHQWLEKQAAAYQPGETGLLALDWWNGNRTTLVDADLSGLILGLSLQTTPVEIYRALMESIAFGTRKVIDTFHHNGVEINELYACGGLPLKNKLLMQIYADVTNRVIKIADSNHTPAIGAAMFGAVAAGEEAGGFNSIKDAAYKMARIKEEVFVPNQKNVEIYEVLYREYLDMYDFFGIENDIMKRLLEHKTSALNSKN